MSTNHEYTCEEHSLTQDTLLKYVWRPIQRSLPETMKPNTITFFGFGFMLLSCLFAGLGVYISSWYYLGTALFIGLYVTCDNVDGLHARATKQSSDLGGFLDHYFDSISFIGINLFVLLALNVSGMYLMGFVSAISLFFYTTIWCHKHSGKFVAGAFGTNEAIFSVMATYIVLAFLPTHPWVVFNPGTINLVSITAIIAGFMILISIIQLAKRTGGEYFQLFAFCVFAGTICSLYYQGGINEVFGALLILTGNAFFCGELHVAHLKKKDDEERTFTTYGIVGCFVGVALLKPSLGIGLTVISCFVLLLAMASIILNDGHEAKKHVANTSSS